ncbi:MAG: hypothetical protein IM542_11665 [Pseudanabaena sp. M165S2SP1A06QC]|nr:hypothetical protein [Pseudanabaena sp. M165S2SP1A06QC]
MVQAKPAPHLPQVYSGFQMSTHSFENRYTLEVDVEQASPAPHLPQA